MPRDESALFHPTVPKTFEKNSVSNRSPCVVKDSLHAREINSRLLIKFLKPINLNTKLHSENTCLKNHSPNSARHNPNVCSWKRKASQSIKNRCHSLTSYQTLKVPPMLSFNNQGAPARHYITSWHSATRNAQRSLWDSRCILLIIHPLLMILPRKLSTHRNLTPRSINDTPV